MEEPKQLSVSELRKKFESKPSTTSTPSTTTKPVQSTTTQPPRQTSNATTVNHQPAASETDTANLSVKERMKMFDKSKNQQETQPLPVQPKKTQVPPQATVNSETKEEENISAPSEQLIASEPEPVQESVQEEQQEEVPEEPIQIEHQEETHQESEQTQEIQQEEIPPQVVAEEIMPEVQEEKAQEVAEEVEEPIQEPFQETVQEEQVQEIVPEVQEEKVQEVVEEVQEPVQEHVQETVQETIQEPEVVAEKQEEQASVVEEKEEAKESETKNPVLNRNADFASEMNAMLSKKGLRSNEDSPIKPEHSSNQGLSSGDAYTDALLTRPSSDPRKKKAKLVFVDDEDF